MKTWFITGAAQGFGREWAEAALDRGDQVVVTSRSVERLQSLAAHYGDRVLALPLDVTDRAAAIASMQQAVDHFGRVDVLINNAGYGLFGALEEVTEEQFREQIEVNLYGVAWLTQAAIPHMRAKGGGHIIQVSSVAGVSAFANLGVYHASKWAVEGMTQAVAMEVAPFGIKMTLIEPARFGTAWAGDSAVIAEPNPLYDWARAARKERDAGRPVGDPTATRAAILAIVDAEEPPLRILFGRGAVGRIAKEYQDRVALWEEWQAVGEAAAGDGLPNPAAS